ncbi:MAG: NADH-quinone oxidoreductase subunit J [Desulfobacterales bacterium]|nr:NADH-quinone oxidoreductase subunit J [Desulfobacterales bacterium]
MTVYAVFFYIIAALIIVSAGMAITRKHMVHAVLYLVVSFLATALLFYLLGAPLLAVFQVIIYAGAIMVLFLFIVMMIRPAPAGERSLTAGRLAAAFGVCGIYVAAALVLAFMAAPEAGRPMAAAAASPFAFGFYLFDRHWLAVEMVSLLLLVALIGALHLGRAGRRNQSERKEPL